MVQQHTHKIKIGRNNWEIKAIEPIDFINEKEIPIDYISIEKEETIFDKLNKNFNNNISGEMQIKSIKSILKAGVISVNNHEPQIDDYFISTDNDDLIELLQVYNKILQISSKLINKNIKINKNNAFLLHTLAEKYNKTPIEFVCNDYTLLDSYLFNVVCYTAGLERENQIKRKALLKRKK